MRLTYAIEMILALSVGMALARVAPRPMPGFGDPADDPRLVRYGKYLVEFCDPFCFGLVLVEGTALWINFIRRRTPKVWGFGRLTWAITFFFAVWNCVEGTFWTAVSEFMSGDEPFSLAGILRYRWERFLDSPGDLLGNSRVSVYLAGLLVTSLTARFPRDPAPDAREWAGRVLYGMLTILYLTHRTLAWYFE